MMLVRLLPARSFGAYMLIVGLSEMMLVAASFGILQVGRRYLPLLITSVPARGLFRFVSTLIALQFAVLGTIDVLVWQSWPRVTSLIGVSAEQAGDIRPAILLLLIFPLVRFSCELLDALLEQGKSRALGALTIYGRMTGVGLLVLAGFAIELRTVVAVDIVVMGTGIVLGYFLLYRSLAALHDENASGEIPVAEIRRFAWTMAPVDLMTSAASPGAMRLALANSLGVLESGLFAFLQSLQNLIGRYLPGTLLRGIVMPALLARAFAPGGRAVVETGASLLIKSNLLIVAAGIVVIAVCGDRLVELLSGGKFPHAGTTLLLMYLALALMAQRNVIDMVMQITGQAKTLRATAVLSPLALLAVWLLAGRGLNVAIAVIITVSAIANGIATAVLARAAGGFALEWRGQAEIFLAAAAAIALGRGLESLDADAFVSTAVALGAFAGLQFVLRPFTAGELAMVEKVIGGRLTSLTLSRLAKKSRVTEPMVRRSPEESG